MATALTLRSVKGSPLSFSEGDANLIALRATADTAFGWGNHALAGYLLPSAVGVSVQGFSAELAAVAGLSATGILARTGSGAYAARTLTAPAAGITLSNGNGVSGNPTLALADDLAALEAATGTNTIYYRSGVSAWSAVTVAVTLSFSAGSLGIDLTHANSWTGKQDLGAGGDLTPASTLSTNAIGYLGAPQIIVSGAYTTVMSDAGKHFYHTSGSAHTITIDSNANVAYPIGTILTFINENGGGNVTIAITSDTLRWGSSTGSRTLAANGTATAIKVTSTVWRLTGDGIT